MSTETFEQALGKQMNGEGWETPVTSQRINDLLGRLSLREAELVNIEL